MEKITIFFIILQVFQCFLCMILGVVLYLRGIQKGILICEMVNTDGSSAMEFFGKAKDAAEFSLIEEDSEERKDRDDAYDKD